jgi:hypothetical protein
MLTLENITTAQSAQECAEQFAELTFRKHVTQIAHGHTSFLSSAVHARAQMSDLEKYALQGAMEDIHIFNQECERRFDEGLPAGFAVRYAEDYVSYFIQMYRRMVEGYRQEAEGEACA